MPNGNVRRTTRSTKEDSSKFAKSSVFRRLGLDSVVSSSTDVYDKQPHSTVSLKDSSVFSRLGRNSAQEASSTSDVVEHMGDDSFLQYKGVFKRLNAKPADRKILRNGQLSISIDSAQACATGRLHFFGAVDDAQPL
ncbi:hypothetical protein GQR58_023210 [Nymphon striatum]|nr:hypothetical protein GQR58_023210 [Nymphon striatum]